MRDLGYGANFSNFGIFSLERLKMQTSNFARRLNVMDTKPKMKNWPREPDLPIEFWDPLISLERL